MTNDERLEAVTHTVELLAAMQKDHDVKLARLEDLTIQIAEGTVRLLHAVEGHEQRISDLEEGNNPQ